MVLYPPCIAAAHYGEKFSRALIKWMLFSMIYPMCFGIFVATLVFSGGSALGLTGTEAMVAFFRACPGCYRL